jgi:uncharacterized protein YbjT (DUF2867 family)
MLLGTGTQRLASLYRDDVVEAILYRALDPETPTGTFELAGPAVVTADQPRSGRSQRSEERRFVHTGRQVACPDIISADV